MDGGSSGLCWAQFRVECVRESDEDSGERLMVDKLKGPAESGCVDLSVFSM